MKNILKVFLFLFEILYGNFLIIIAILYRYKNKENKIGLGNMPMINNIYHKKALQKYGFYAETFCRQPFYITSEFDRVFHFKNKILDKIVFDMFKYDFIHVLRNYACVYHYFNGVCLGNSPFLWRIEPTILKIAKIKSVVMPYGGDVQSLRLSGNVLFKTMIQKDYPQYGLSSSRIEKNISMWSRSSNHVISGCNWIEYMHYWNTLMISHFAIDVDAIEFRKRAQTMGKAVRVLHAPNHRNVKATGEIIKVIEELKADGFNIDFVLLEKKENSEVLREISQADLVIDQLVIGWYAMFAIEAMASGVPVISYINPSLKEVFINAGLFQLSEFPIISANTGNLRQVLSSFIADNKFEDSSLVSRKFIEKYHSVDYVGSIFARINDTIKIYPSKNLQ